MLALRSVAALCIASVLPLAGAAQPRPDRLVEYRIASGDTLRLHAFEPQGLGEAPRPAVLFFFGGGWVSGSPAQFYPHAAYLAGRGAVGLVAEYRVRDRHGTSPFEAVADAVAAMRYVRAHASELGVDPERVVAAGGSAGGHLAAATAALRHLHGVGGPSPVPQALVLFNPVVDTSPLGFGADRLGKRWADLSPIHHLTEDAPPTLIFHGTADTTVPFAHVEAYCAQMRVLGGRCELVGFDGYGHAFFNHGRHGNVPYHTTLAAMDAFLIDLGLLAEE